MPNNIARSICPDPDRPESFPAPKSVDEFVEMIGSYLDNGCRIEQIFSTLVKQDWIKPDYSLADFDDDNEWEIVIAASIAPCPGGENTCALDPDGIVLVYDNDNGSWTATVLYHDWYIREAKIVAIQDLIGSPSPELVFRYHWRGSGCEEGVHIYQWDNGNWSEVQFETPQIGIRQYYPSSMNCGLRVDIEQPSNVENKNIVISSFTGPGYYTHGGVGRRFILTYAWNGRAYQPASLLFYPSPYRIHVLEDAQVAFDDENLYEAAYYYRKAATDKSLLNELSLSEEGPVYLNNATLREMENVAYAYQTGFARFRLVTIWQYLGYAERAVQEMKNIAQLYPSDTPGSEFFDISNYYLGQIEISKDAYQACTEVSRYIQREYPLLTSHFDWGIQNIYYMQAEDICPFIIVENENGG